MQFVSGCNSLHKQEENDLCTPLFLGQLGMTILYLVQIRVVRCCRGPNKCDVRGDPVGSWLSYVTLQIVQQKRQF